LTWFNGGNSSFYISSYVLKGFGMMEKDSLFISHDSGNEQHKKFIQKLIDYTDSEFSRLLNRNNNSLIYYVYARSFWQKQNPLTDSLKQNIRTFLFNEWKSGENKPLYDQSLLIIASFRFANRADELITQATKQINSIRQLAIKDEQNGMRWKELADADNLNISSEETSALLAEAFQESESNDTIQNEILKWLLTAKNEHSWGSTKATAAAINLLYKKDESAIGETQTIALSVGNKKTIVNDDLLKGSSYSFLPINLLPSSIYLKKENPGIASGNFIWYYFTTGSLLNNVNKDILQVGSKRK
jgi:alpha-2-macroglobulin